jgi:fatty-acid desaturase
LCPFDAQRKALVMEYVVVPIEEEDEISVETWNKYLKVKNIYVKPKKDYRKVLANLGKFAVTVAIIGFAWNYLGILYFAVVTTLTMVFSTLFVFTYMSMLTGELGTRIRPKTRKKKKDRIIDGINGFLSKQI